VESSIPRDAFFVTSEVTCGRKVALSLGASAMSDSDPNTPIILVTWEASLVTFEGKSWKLGNIFATPPQRNPEQRFPAVTLAGSNRPDEYPDTVGNVAIKQGHAHIP
jgi:hypothetical protein